MKTILKPIALNERSYNVTLLHKALEALGLPVSKDETTQGIAGQDTLKQVRALQAQLNVPVDKYTLVNEATSLAIAVALKERGLTAASRSFTVTGLVKLQNGAVKKRQRLIAFDLDLHGVAVYRTVKNVEEIKKSGGFEFLGQAVSDNLGNYSITFYDWQYGQAERKKADVVVYAIEGEEVIGHSRLVNSEDYSDKGLVRDLDIIITQEEKRTEYEVLMNGLIAFLKESKTSLSEIAKSRDQLIFTAGELDVDQLRIDIAASAELLRKEKEENGLSHELLYGIGRQGIRLDWAALYKKHDEDLHRAIAKSVDERIIRKFQDEEVTAFLKAIQEYTVRHMLEDKEKDGKNTLNAMLKHALPEEEQRLSFVNALRDFKGSDFREFWDKHLPAHPEFKDKPDLISGLLLTQQLTLLTGNHQALVHELQVNRKLTSAHQLIEFEKSDWREIIRKTGVPDSIEGKDDEEKIDRYADLIENRLNKSFPTQRIAKMVEKDELPIEKTRVSKSISAFLSKNPKFDFAGKRIHDFKKEIKEIAGKDYDEVRNELKKIQRVFQVSTSPEAMSVLMEKNLHSAYTIANIPRKSFVKTYGNALGGEDVASAIHQRASHISTRTEMIAMHMMEYSHGLIPQKIMGPNEYKAAMTVIEKHLPNPTPNYAALFGSPDVCECGHCRSVYSAAAYFVELLRFLKNSPINDVGHTPFDILIGKKDAQGNIRVRGRRPDLLHLPLTCENTNTNIPYIDLANEVMEYYTANATLDNFKGHDTGNTTEKELRANPQNFNLEAYRILSNYKEKYSFVPIPLPPLRRIPPRPETKKAVYPFTLPYHQPLDVIRTYSGHLRVSRYEAMRAMNPQPDAPTTRAIEAESLKISQEEYMILTGEAFDGTADTTPLHEYYGYTAAGQLKYMSEVREFLKRSGLVYTDLVELVKTQFINPYQGTLKFLEELFSYVSPLIDASIIYTMLEGIETAGTLDLVTHKDIADALTAYNSANGTSITTNEFAQWVIAHLSEFRQVITLYEPDSKCDLDTTRLKTIQNVYAGLDASGITSTWSKIHRFIRLWRKLGWTMHETDLMLAALGEDDITPETISKLESVSLLHAATKLPLNQLAVLWGNIDTYGKKSLYKKLFLNKAVQLIDEAFKADAWGNYLQDETEILTDHQSAILAAFRITEEELNAILEVAQVIDGGNPRNLDMESDILNIQNLSTIYRYVVLAKALKMRITDLCKLIRLFNASPFSTWDIQKEAFTNISPEDTYEFYKLAASTKEVGFKSSVLEYILEGTLPADSTLGLDKDKTLQTAKAIRDAFAAIEQDHPETPELPLTVEILIAKLSVTFQTEIVSRFMGIIEGSAPFETKTDIYLNITIPDDESQGMVIALVASGVVASQDKAKAFLREFSRKYAYVSSNGKGRLTCTGVMTDIEREVLKGLPNVNANFEAAVDELYAMPATFISNNFNGIFSALAAANVTLLDHPAQAPAATLEEKLAYVYERFIPILKSKLRKDAITQHIAALIGLSEEATALVIATEIDTLIKNLSTEGLSATYFSDVNWNTSVLERVDSAIDFSWGTGAPDQSVPANNFSVRWTAYIAAPASGEYTLMVEVEEADEAFNLYLDDTLMLEKAAGNANTSWEVVVNLNAAQMHLLTLEYAETSRNAGVRLYWKTAATAREIIPSSVAYPAAILDAFVEQATVFHRAAKFISGFGISETELNHFITFHADFGNIDFKSLTADHWERIRDYAVLRDAVPQAQALLTDVFALANRLDPRPTVDQLTEMLQLATAWDQTSLEYLVTTHFTLGVDDFKNEIALNRLYEVMKIVKKTGISAETIAEWGAAKTNFYTLHKTAQLIKNTVKAKYEEEDWLDIAGDLSDKIRKNQQQALISYLLMQPEIQAWGARDADGLFEYFLIDVQMGACMDTSRIVQANAAIQMFVNRCLLNLESTMSVGTEKGVSPSAIDKDRWEWMKNYRVWEANRKVFLYPENWLEPEWRNNRSEFFKELESYLVQNDITERSVEQALRNYLMNLNEVTNLDVCGMYQENDDGGKLKYLHVFARTHNAPYKFFYRTWNEHRKWSAWEKVPVDIPDVEEVEYILYERIYKSGVYLIPVVWKKRLFLFWAEFMEKQESTVNTNQSVEQAGTGSKISDLEPQQYWEIRLAWSEYVDGKWSPKQVSKEFAIVDSSILSEFSVSAGKIINAYFSFSAEVHTSTQELSILMWHSIHKTVHVQFILSYIQSKIVIRRGKNIRDLRELYTVKLYEWLYAAEFMKLRVAGVGVEGGTRRDIMDSPILVLRDRLYLRHVTNHRLLVANNDPNAETRLDYPFFFSDDYRTYFVRPVDIERIKVVKNPKSSKPLYGDVASKNDVGPDDYTSWEGRTMHFTKGATDKGLEFHTFYHPYSSKYVTRLNQGGIPALMGSDTENPSVPDAVKSDEGDTFNNAYGPNFNNGFVQPSIYDLKINDKYKGKTYYKENVCFDVYGANSLYNWELFFHVPLYIATRLSKNGKYEEAMKWFHYIFDPTTDDMPRAGEDEISRYWKVLPFKTTPVKRLEDWFMELNNETDPSSPDYNPQSELSAIVSEWRDNPFDPHLVASNRPLAYMKHVVIKYVENLIAWGDSLFRQFTRENVNEALQIYVIANHILGPKPEFVPKRGEIKAESYDSLKDKWDDFSNALVELENIFPYSSDVSARATSAGTNMLGSGPALYFCIPANEKLLEYWDTVADRLYKIRHCQDIDGVERKLALFAPPISPEALIQAVSQGLSLGSILADLSSPPPIYRFTYLIQKCNEFCSDVKALGAALLAALEKIDAEELSRMRASHETYILDQVTAIRERQVLEAKANRENLIKARETAKFRFKHYTDLLGIEPVKVPAEPSIPATLTADSPLPVDTSIPTIKTDVDESLVESDERGVKLIPKEKEELDKTEQAHYFQLSASVLEGIAGIAHAFPQMSVDGKPLGVGAGALWGGQNIGFAASSSAKVAQIISSQLSFEANRASKMASYIRREQDWTLQANLVAREIIQLDKQITSADIRIQVAEKELKNHQEQVKNSKAVELFLKNKFTNQELYQWMKEQLFAVYKQSYNLAYDMAKKAEKAYKYERGTETANFIQYGYWDNYNQGLVAGEKLQLALRQLEKLYLEENRRELELTKSISLAMLNPLALIELRETGKCYVSLPEELFDLDFQGHYFRRIKSVSLSIPCIAGPYTTVNCSLRLLNNHIRVKTTMNSKNNYEHENDEGLWSDDDRFRTSNVLVTSIATSSGQNDAGMFEFNFRDERYLPFEGAGAISDWLIELGGANYEADAGNEVLRQFDYSTISDVILHLRYTAREDGGLKESAVTYIKKFIMNSDDLDLPDQPLMRMFSMKHEFPTEWHKFLHPGVVGGEQILNITIGKNRFPFFAQDRKIVVMKMEVYAKCTQEGDYHMILSYINFDGDPITSPEDLPDLITMPQNNSYGGLNKATIPETYGELNLVELDISREMSLKLQYNTAGDFKSLATKPDADEDEVEDIFLVFHYKMG